jgi:small subunit ribosomal protein S8
MNNSVIDLIIRIKNGYMARKETIESPYSKFREEILKKLIKLGYVGKVDIENGKAKKFVIELIYKDGIPTVTDFKIFSKPGRRFYVSYKELKLVLGGLGCSILSTPKGILTNQEARRQKIGGELLFQLW